MRGGLHMLLSYILLWIKSDWCNNVFAGSLPVPNWNCHSPCRMKQQSRIGTMGESIKKLVADYRENRDSAWLWRHCIIVLSPPEKISALASVSSQVFESCQRSGQGIWGFGQKLGSPGDQNLPSTRRMVMRKDQDSSGCQQQLSSSTAWCNMLGVLLPLMLWNAIRPQGTALSLWSWACSCVSHLFCPSLKHWKMWIQQDNKIKKLAVFYARTWIHAFHPPWHPTKAACCSPAPSPCFTSSVHIYSYSAVSQMTTKASINRVLTWRSVSLQEISDFGYRKK